MQTLLNRSCWINNRMSSRKLLEDISALASNERLSAHLTTGGKVVKITSSKLHTCNNANNCSAMMLEQDIICIK